MYKLNFKQAMLSCLVLSSTSAFAADPNHLEMPHSAGTAMVEYKFMRMNMEGLQSGKDSVSNDTALSMMGNNHLMIPTKMTMDMHMLMPMYNFTRDTSIMMMATYMTNKMDMEMRAMGSNPPAVMDMETSGLGDTSISINHKFADELFAASFEVSIPTGSIDEKATTMMNGMAMEATAPYPMQLGSGTYDVKPSLTYLGAYYDLRFGAQASYKLRTGENDNGYTLGDEAEVLTWVRKPVFGVILDAELRVKKWGAIDGKDSSISTMDLSMNNGMMTGKASPTSFPTNTGGTIGTLSVGATLPIGFNYIGADVTIPVYQDLNGLQMKRKTSASISLIAHF